MAFIPTEEQWEKMKRHIKSDAYKKEDFFVFETLATGDRVIPNRYTRLMPDLLETMREDAIKGVSLMLNHNWGQLGVQSIPIGKVFDARIGIGTQDGETVALYTTQYILRDDSKVDGYSKNDIIKLIESGIISDTSVGISTPLECQICSICGNPIYDFRKCEHVPGRKYIVNEETNEVKECIIEVHSPANKVSTTNNVLMENSVVFDGAYPNAIIQSAIGDVSNKENLIPLDGKKDSLSNGIVFGYSSKGDMNLFYKQLSEKGGIGEMAKFNEEPEEETKLEEEKVETTEVEAEEVPEEVEAPEVVEEPEAEPEEAPAEVNDEAEVEEEAKEEETVETPAETEAMYTEKDILNKFDNISDNLDALIQLAKEGFENRKEVIQQALTSGVHSMGNSFNKEVFERTFSNLQTKDIKEMGEVWEAQAKAQFSDKKISQYNVVENPTENVKENVDLKQFKTANY